MNAESLSTNSIHVIYQVLVGINFMALHIGLGNRVEQIYLHKFSHKFNNRKTHRREACKYEIANNLEIE